MTDRRDEDKDTEIRREKRRQRALERLGTNNPHCVRCSESDPLALELHHIAGRAFDNSTCILCRNCHRKLTDRQKEHPDKLTEIPDPLEAIAHFLLGLADLFEMLVGKFREFASHLISLADPNRDNLEPES